MDTNFNNVNIADNDFYNRKYSRFFLDIFYTTVVLNINTQPPALFHTGLA